MLGALVGFGVFWDRGVPISGRGSLVLALFLVVGALTSMLSTTDPSWWQKNLSALGISDDISAMAFNLTLVVAGVMVTTIAAVLIFSWIIVFLRNAGALESSRGG